jgi:hypothetical protein
MYGNSMNTVCLSVPLEGIFHLYVSGRNSVEEKKNIIKNRSENIS